MADRLLIADTDLVIDFLRGQGSGADLVGSALSDRSLRLTAVTAFELRIGAAVPRQRRHVEALLARRTLPLDAPAALLAGEIHARLERKGTRIGVADALIAGICRRFDLPLATRNARHSARVTGLELIEI